jgi:heme/copper-type cytochrome/quinol oxidase subunit 4
MSYRSALYIHSGMVAMTKLNERTSQVGKNSDRSRESALQVPRWLIVLPVICTLVAVIVVASAEPGPASLVIFLISVFVVGCIYFYLIMVWHLRRRAIDTCDSQQ